MWRRYRRRLRRLLRRSRRSAWGRHRGKQGQLFGGLYNIIKGIASMSGSNGKIDAAARRTAVREYCYLRFCKVAATSVMTIFAYSVLLCADAA